MKKTTIVSLVLVFILVVCSVFSTFILVTASDNASNSQIIGDVDSDGVISIMDATNIQMYLAGLIEFTDDMMARANVLGNDRLSVLDATAIQRYLAQLEGYGCTGDLLIKPTTGTTTPTEETTEPTQGEQEINAPSVLVGKVTAKAGETVIVPITIYKNPGINGMQLNVSYDSELALVKAEKGEALARLTLTLPTTYKNPCKFLWDGINENENSNGEMLKLSFKIPAGAKEGDVYTINAVAPEGSVYDSDFNDILFDIIGGTITVEKDEVVTPTDPTVKPTEDVTEITKPSVEIKSVSANAGERVVVPVIIHKNPGINGMQLNISYDEALKLVKAESGNALPSLILTQPGSYGNPSRFLWDGLNENEKGNGEVLKLTFDVPSNAKSGDSYGISVTSPDGSIYDLDFNDVAFEMINGKISVK